MRFLNDAQCTSGHGLQRAEVLACYTRLHDVTANCKLPYMEIDPWVFISSIHEQAGEVVVLPQPTCAALCASLHTDQQHSTDMIREQSVRVSPRIHLLVITETASAGMTSD